MLYLFKTCVHTIKQLSHAIHDKTRPEDLDTDQEDHALDETRYACMARPLTIKVKDSRVREEGKIYLDIEIERLKQKIKEHDRQLRDN